MFSGWAKGKYTIDTMYLIFGPVFELIMTMLDDSEIEYTALAKRKEDESLVKMMSILEKRKEQIGDIDSIKISSEESTLNEEEEKDEEEEEEDIPSGGLMGRPE